MRALLVRNGVGRGGYCRVRRWLRRQHGDRAVAVAAASLRASWRSHSDTPSASHAAPPPPPPPPPSQQQQQQPPPQQEHTAQDAGDADAVAELPAIAMARRVVQPSAAYPASPCGDEPVDPCDPRIEWRELYSLEYQRPYYHNVCTDEVTYTIPDGFVTRFRGYYTKRGYTVDERNVVWRTRQQQQQQRKQTTEATGDAAEDAAAAAVQEQEQEQVARPLTMRQKLATYGAGGLLWYLVIHNVSLVCIFTCMYVLRINLVEVARSYGLRIAKPTAGQQPQQSASSGSAHASAPTRQPPLWRTLLESFVLNKMLVPLHVLLTVATAPLIMHRLTPIASAVTPWCQRCVQRIRSTLRPAS